MAQDEWRLDAVEMNELDGDYTTMLEDLQQRLRLILESYLFSRDSAVVVFEGMDAAGKGGTIRRITALMDPRGVKVWPIGPPRDYYKERHYLARFWDKLPARGAISIFDRSWYGRVLVERVEKFASDSQWRRAYEEINQFEKMLCDDGVRVVKFFLHITPDEQLERFKARLDDPTKRWKLTYEDFRNRNKWDEYVAATEEMLERTSTSHAPWHLIGANSKKAARIEVMSILADALGAGIDLAPVPVPDEMLRAASGMFDLPDDLKAVARAKGFIA